MKIAYEIKPSTLFIHELLSKLERLFGRINLQCCWLGPTTALQPHFSPPGQWCVNSDHRAMPGLWASWVKNAQPGKHFHVSFKQKSPQFCWYIMHYQLFYVKSSKSKSWVWNIGTLDQWKCRLMVHYYIHESNNIVPLNSHNTLTQNSKFEPPMPLHEQLLGSCQLDPYVQTIIQW